MKMVEKCIKCEKAVPGMITATFRGLISSGHRRTVAGTTSEVDKVSPWRL